MDLKHMATRLIAEINILSEPDWQSLIAQTLGMIDQNQSVEELSAFFEMGPYDLPLEVLIAAQEKMLHLGDWSKKTLDTYAQQLDLYYVKHRLKDWLLSELARLESSNSSVDEYHALGKEVLRWLREEDVNG